ncbi:MAG: glutamine--fructose-6-phosphate transaminase (isomerizing) [Candidatus Levybacteria bacterium]|nr:glutamine--fructose-6-phosphate transaminase (isomerizing) [Candidatus Levybacteria bacterium]
MCGIFGYVGKKTNAAGMILEGLRLLEYRGYDSWGIATKVKSQNAKVKSFLAVEKHVGKIGDAKVDLPQSALGIGHTRWATHGGVTQENSHPHLDCTKNIAVVHNGIIENYQELKEVLLKKGHSFLSETDTEVFPHLIEEYLASKGETLQGKGFTEAFRLAFNQIKGLNAIVAINADTNEIAAAKTGSPLIIGVSENEFYVASDAIGILKHTNKIVFLEDNQMVMLGKKLRLTKLPEGEELEPAVNTLDWKFEDAIKGRFEHFLLKEIHEQPQVISNIALNYSDQTKKLAKLIKESYGTFLLGCGTASYAGLFGTYLFSSIAKRHVNFSIGSEFNYLENYLTPKSLVIPISQSGETIDIVEPVNRAKQKGSKVASLVNVLGSTLYRQSDFKVLLGAGSEKAVIGTKSFTAMISVLFLTAYTLVKKQKEAKNLLLSAAKNVEEILKEDYTKNIKKLALEFKNKEHIYILGRGLSYATALEATLKIKETTYVHAEGFAGGELKHGVIALIEKGTPVFIIAPNDETFDDIISNAQEVKARGGFIIGIGPRKSDVFDRFLQTRDITEATIIPQVVISQLFAYYLALSRGIKDPDKPRNLAKSVTVK